MIKRKIRQTGKKWENNGARSAANGGRDRRQPFRGLRHPKTELESAIQRYVDLYDFAPIAYISFDRSGRIEEANLAATELLGEPRNLLVGRPFAFYVADLDSLLKHLLHCRTSQQEVKTELLLKARTGEKIPAVLLSSPITSTIKQGALLYQTAIIDLRDRKAAEEALRAKEAELEAIINQTPFMLTRCTRDLHYRFVSRAYAKMLGYTPDEVAGKPIVKIIGERGLKTILPYVERVLQGDLVEYETGVSYHGVPARSVHCVYTPEHDEKGNVIGWFGSITDITRRKRAETALRRSKELLEKLVQKRTQALRSANAELHNEIARRKGLEGQILEISDREQQRLAQELHDGLCQELTAIGFMARATARRVKDHRVLLPEDIDKIATLVNKAATDARNISRALHRVDVDAAGLVDALQSLATREIWKTPCRLDIQKSFQIDHDRTAVNLYGIAREAVVNANKHARAREITIGLKRSKREIMLTVSDDGLGLKEGDGKSRGMGFHIMNYRAQSIGGRLEVESRKGAGTRISCFLPIPK